MTSSTYPLVADAVTTPIAADTDIIEFDVDILANMVNPGGGGVLRLYFSFELAVTPAIISVFNNSTLVGQLNADNAFETVSQGYYRFDIGVEDGDAINIQSSEIINTVNQVRAHLVQFGA